MLTASFLLAAASALTSTTVAQNERLETSGLTGQSVFKSAVGSQCPARGQSSCHNTTKVENLCCFESPGGLLLQTQFWDTKPSTGPSDSWTIHGLWPDKCDTTIIENCDPSRAYTGIDTLLSDNGADDTLEFMKQFWVNINGDDEELWEHEWETHGTCLSTLDTSCLPRDSVTGAEAISYYQTTIRLFQTLPTYTWLANAGIKPTKIKTFTLRDLTSALASQSRGIVPALSCSNGVLNRVSWYFNLKGSVMDGQFMPISAPKAGNCPKSGIRYPPKTGRPPANFKAATPAPVF